MGEPCNLDHAKGPYHTMIEVPNQGYATSLESISPTRPRRISIKNYDYSADNSITILNSNEPSPRDESGAQTPTTPLKNAIEFKHSGKKVFFNKKWSDDTPSPPNEKVEEEPTAESFKHHIKFVKGLPTVVTKPKSYKFYCLNCHFEGHTKLEHKISKSLIVLMVIFFITLFWPCLIYALCSNHWKDIIHYCPNCGHVVGKRKVTL